MIEETIACVFGWRGGTGCVVVVRTLSRRSVLFVRLFCCMADSGNCAVMIGLDTDLWCRVSMDIKSFLGSARLNWFT